MLFSEYGLDNQDSDSNLSYAGAPRALIALARSVARCDVVVSERVDGKHVCFGKKIFSILHFNTSFATQSTFDLRMSLLANYV